MHKTVVVNEAIAMNLNNRFNRWAFPVGVLFLFATTGPALRAQDQGYDPEQAKRAVARISLLNGDVSIKRGEADVVAAAPNTPLVTEDRIYSGPSSRAEVQFDYANFLRMAGDAEVRLAQVEAGHYVLQLARGTVRSPCSRTASSRKPKSKRRASRFAP